MVGQIEAALDGQMSFVLDLLGQHFAQNKLLGEVFASDNDAISAWRSAGNEANGGKRSYDLYRSPG